MIKIHSLCIVKNEEDIIENTLSKAIIWSDFIYIFDNGSTDKTWEKVINLAKRNEQIIPYKKDDLPWSDALRGMIFNQYRKNFNQGDWICRLDADEIYIDNPSLFLAKVPQKYEVVCAAMFTYYFTDIDLEKYDKNPDLYSDNVSVEDKIKYYRNDESEIRFFRYKEKLTWPEKQECLISSDYKDWPTGLKGDGFPIRIWLKNYRYRSPQQIQKRIDLRQKLTQKELFPQEMKYKWKEKMANIESINDFENWKSRIAKSSILNYDSGNLKYILNEDSMLDINENLAKYFIKINHSNFIKYFLGKPLKRQLTKLGILPRPYN